MYTIGYTRLNLTYAVSTVSRFMSNPGKQHWKAVKCVLRYLRGTGRLGLAFQRLKTKKLKILQGYVDADYIGDHVQRKSTTDYVFIVAESFVIWKAKLQDIVALLTTEVEYMATVETSKEALWFRRWSVHLESYLIQFRSIVTVKV